MDLFPPPQSLAKPLLTLPKKIMMGPGPSNAPQRVLDALALPVLGHMHPETFQIMDEIKAGCQYIFQTNNPVTLCLSASGHGGMEAALCNLLEEGDVVLIGVTGIWGLRASDMARRIGADVRTIEAKPGQILSTVEIEEYMKVHLPAVLFVTQGDSSTGVLQPIEDLGELCRKYNCLLLVDTVASLGGTPFYADKWGVDVVYTGSQKVLGAPPGITPISFSCRAMKKIKNRSLPIKSYYWDINLVGDYWACFGRPRIYHHTVSTTLLYGLREALAIFCEDGLAASIERHSQCAKRLQLGVASMGLQMFVGRLEDRLPTVNAIRVPANVDWKQLSDYAMKCHLVELAGGLGPTAGAVLRVGLMGINATSDRVDLVLRVLQEALAETSGFLNSKI